MVLFGTERNRIVVIVLLLVLVFAMVNLAFNLENLALGPEVFPEFGKPSGDGGEVIFQPPVKSLRAFFQYLLYGLIAVLVISLIYLGWKRRSRQLLIEMIGFILALIIILVFFALWTVFSGVPLFTPGEVVSDPSDPSEGSEGSASPSSAAPAGLGVIAIAFLLILLVLFLTSRFGRKEGIGPPLDVRKRAIDHLEETIYRLELGEEVRAAILRCYSGMIRLFKKRGLRYGSHVTARELESLALESLGLTGRSTVRLREIFEEARYSSHHLSEEYRETAVQCLNSVKGELEALFVAR